MDVGISKSQWAVAMLRRKPRSWYVAVIAAVLTLLFAVLSLMNPFSSSALLWIFIAVTLKLEGVVDLIALILGRK